ncbi:hypothetical protein CKM354_000901400 [Cercospora kikuchii]|uniref:Uncharacterized protein n=1 Tax=Cercospora kikuchii TaxID=84275 RepID=A0A9P3CNI1_9PEZI|nr:uncharacterized protein CKM354_000901400 [Cercospora kikuchii]GIZ45866.1 hypothetical protein CKM354_000901400 [Cercospora kikuchii]
MLPLSKVYRKHGVSHGDKYSWVRRQEEEKETAALPAISVEQFVHLAAGGKATKEQARSCLYHLKNDLQVTPLSERHPDSEARRIGERVLHWLWSQDMTVRDALSLDRIFVNCLCYFSVAEGRDNDIWNWLLHEMNNEKRDVDVPERHLWVVGIMDAQVELSDSLVLPLKTLERALKDFSGKHLKWMIMAALVSGSRMTKSTTLPPYDPALSTVLISANKISTHGTMRAHNEAMIMLYHPTEPNGKLFLDMAPTYLQFGMKTSRKMTSRAFSINALRAAYILRLQNDEKGAVWLEDAVESRCPQVWDVRQKWLRRFEADPKLEELRRQSTSRSSATFDHWK